MNKMQRGAAGNSTPKRKTGKTKHPSFARETSPVKFLVLHAVTGGDAAGPWPPSPGYWAEVRCLPGQQTLWRKIELRSELTGWPADLVAEVAAAPCRDVAGRLIALRTDAIAVLPDDVLELLNTTLQDTLAELPER